MCEACDGATPATHVCSGLEVPALYFCAEHAEWHAANCPHILDQSAAITEIASAERKAEHGTERERADRS